MFGFHPATTILPTLRRIYPVLYLLDGDSLFDACTAYLHEELYIDETLTTLITSGTIPPLIAVGVDNGSDVIDQNSDRPKSDNGSGRAIEYMPYSGTAFLPALRDVRGAQLPDFLEHDVMPAVAAKYRVLSDSKKPHSGVHPCLELLRFTLLSSAPNSSIV